MSLSEYGMLASDWRAEQRIEDLRAAMGPWVTARVNGNKEAELENFMVLGGKKADQPKKEQTQDEMAEVFRNFAKRHNEEHWRRERLKENGRKA